MLLAASKQKHIFGFCPQAPKCFTWCKLTKCTQHFGIFISSICPLPHLGTDLHFEMYCLILWKLDSKKYYQTLRSFRTCRFPEIIILGTKSRTNKGAQDQSKEENSHTLPAGKLCPQLNAALVMSWNFWFYIAYLRPLDRNDRIITEKKGWVRITLDQGQGPGFKSLFYH